MTAVSPQSQPRFDRAEAGPEKFAQNDHPGLSRGRPRGSGATEIHFRTTKTHTCPEQLQHSWYIVARRPSKGDVATWLRLLNGWSPRCGCSTASSGHSPYEFSPTICLNSRK
jgi:hypothetical protein